MSWTTWLIIIVILQLIHFLGTWKLYVKAGRQVWEAAIPVYSVAIWLKIINRPMWWCFIPFLPIIGPILLGVLWYDTPKSFGKEKKDSILAVITVGLYLFYLNYVDNVEYQKIEDDDRKETFVSSILYAVVVATFIHLFVIQPFIIPTGSMEKTLLVGDGLFVNKWSYGYRVPQTPIGIPFLQNYIPYTGNQKQYSNGAIEWKEKPTKNYIDAIRLPYSRIAQFNDVEANDIVVFNYPADSLNTATDRKDPYVKRCIGTPGSTLEVKNGVVFINGKEFQYPNDAIVCSSYIVKTKNPFSDKFLLETPYLVTDPNNLRKIAENTYFFTSLSKEEVKMLKNKDIVISIEENLMNDNNVDDQIFPKDAQWNRDNYGPLYIPKKGDKIELNAKNYTQYKDLIKKYEHNTLEYNNGTFTINGKQVTNYTVKQDYYFMMGDNRHNSLDSRYFGYVPFDHVLGSPILTWLSIDWKKGSFSLRPDRMMTIPNNGEKEKTSFLWLVGVLVLGYLGYSFVKDKQKKKEEEY